MYGVLFPVDHQHGRRDVTGGQQLFKFLGTKENFNMRNKFSPLRTFSVHQYGRHFIVLYTNMATVTSYENYQRNLSIPGRLK